MARQRPFATCPRTLILVFILVAYVTFCLLGGEPLIGPDLRKLQAEESETSETQTVIEGQDSQLSVLQESVPQDLELRQEEELEQNEHQERWEGTAATPEPSPKAEEAVPQPETVAETTASAIDASGPGGERCMGPTVPEMLPHAEAKALQKKATSAAQKWGYFTLAPNYSPFKGKRLLDIGMGQGPMGVVAIKSGVKSYVGLDPALCINQKARTRDKSTGRLPNPIECQLIKESSACAGKSTCEKFIECEKAAAKKYREFPITGLDIMRGFGKQLLLLPGTFETIKPTGLVKPGSFDVATLWLVTEHLPNNHLVIESVFEWTTPGQLLALKHHNYYGFDGHHNKPTSPSSYDPHNAAERGVVNWNHLEPSSWVFNYTNTNRLRLGDLMALIDVYFDCAWSAQFPPAWTKALTPALLERLERRGFSKTELLLNKWVAACERREKALEAPWLESRIWLHPPTDGSYKPRPLPKTLQGKENKPGGVATHSGQSYLKKYLVSR